MKKQKALVVLKGLMQQLKAAIDLLEQEAKIEYGTSDAAQATNELKVLFGAPDAVNATDELPNVQLKAFTQYIAAYNEITGSKIRGTEDTKKQFLARLVDLRKIEKLPHEEAVTLIIEVMKHRVRLFKKSKDGIQYDALTFVRKSNFERYCQDFKSGKAITQTQKFNDADTYL